MLGTFATSESGSNLLSAQTLSYLFFMKMKLKMVLRQDIIRSAMLRFTRK